jgi:phage terminase large subunit GpA-like protein
MFDNSFDTISERRLLGSLLLLFKRASRDTTIEWTESKRTLSAEESSIRGKFRTDRTPAFKYIYHCCDNWYIHVVGMMKSSQIGASEMENNVIGRTMDIRPVHAAIFFPGTTLLKDFSRKRLKKFFDSCKPLKDKLNIGIPKPSHEYFTFPGGSIVLKTLGSIQAVLSAAYALLIFEEFAQVKADVANQGDPLGLGIGRQKSLEIGYKKILAFSTPTFKDVCNMEKFYNRSFQLIFKAQCHHCAELVELSGWTMESLLKYDMYGDRYIDQKYGKYNPESATFACTKCNGDWSFENKKHNIISGLNYGFIDHCGEFSFGWHPRVEDWKIYHIEEYRAMEDTIDKVGLRRALRRDKISLFYAFQHPEILACFAATSNAPVLAAKKLEADIAIEKGDETLAKDWYNNSLGLPYTSGITAIEAEEMKTFRKNYAEGICPMEALITTVGIDVQDNRFASIVRGWGRNNNSWLIKWEEIFGDVLVQERERDSTGEANGRFLGVWGEIWDKYVVGTIPHASGKSMKVSAISIDSGDNTELVYKFVKAAAAYFEENNTGQYIFATKGTRDLRYSDNEIYQEPISRDTNATDNNIRISLAEKMGVPLYYIGAHKAHEEILRRIALNKKSDAISNLYYHNEQSYGLYEEQMTSCRKIIDGSTSYKSVFKLISGKRKEAMDAEKNALHAAYAINIRNLTHAYWQALESYYYNYN